jgi:hypothetical protein
VSVVTGVREPGILLDPPFRERARRPTRRAPFRVVRAPPETRSGRGRERSAMRRNVLLESSERFGHMLSRALLTVLYFGVLGPFAVLYRIASDPLRLRRPRDSNWTRWTGRNDTLARARRQD